jgi:hypothetical protein
VPLRTQAEFLGHKFDTVDRRGATWICLRPIEWRLPAAA